MQMLGDGTAIDLNAILVGNFLREGALQCYVLVLALLSALGALGMMHLLTCLVMFAVRGDLSVGCKSI